MSDLRKLLPPPRIAAPSPSHAPDPVEALVNRVRSARSELREARPAFEAAAAECVEAIAVAEKSYELADQAIDAEKAAVERVRVACEEYTAALSEANRGGLAVQLMLERERLFFVDEADVEPNDDDPLDPCTVDDEDCDYDDLVKNPGEFHRARAKQAAAASGSRFATDLARTLASRLAPPTDVEDLLAAHRSKVAQMRERGPDHG